MTDRPYLNTSEVAELLNRTDGAVRNLVLRRAISFRKQGGRLIFLRSELQQWIERAPGMSLDELMKERDYS